MPHPQDDVRICRRHPLLSCLWNYGAPGKMLVWIPKDSYVIDRVRPCRHQRQTVGDESGGAILASLSASDRELAKIRCRSVMADPTVYKSQVVNLCLLVAKM